MCNIFPTLRKMYLYCIHLSVPIKIKQVWDPNLQAPLLLAPSHHTQCLLCSLVVTTYCHFIVSLFFLFWIYPLLNPRPRKVPRVLSLLLALWIPSAGLITPSLLSTRDCPGTCDCAADSQD